MKRAPRKNAKASSTAPSRINVDPTILAGRPIVLGTRISVEFVIDLLASGWTTAQILEEYDHLKPEDIRGCLACARRAIVADRGKTILAPRPAGAAVKRRSNAVDYFARLTRRQPKSIGHKSRQDLDRKNRGDR